MPPRRRNPSRRCKPSPPIAPSSPSISPRQLTPDHSPSINTHSSHSSYSVKSVPEPYISDVDDPSGAPRKRPPQKQVKRTNVKKKKGAQTAEQQPKPSTEQLSEKQLHMLDQLFCTFDPHGNGRITLTDLLRVADDLGLPYTIDEAKDMLRFWDTSGTSTISRSSFTDLALECKFITNTAKS